MLSVAGVGRAAQNQGWRARQWELGARTPAGEAPGVLYRWPESDGVGPNTLGAGSETLSQRKCTILYFINLFTLYQNLFNNFAQIERPLWLSPEYLRRKKIISAKIAKKNFFFVIPKPRK